MEFRERLYQLRKGRGISQEELANAVGVSRQAVQKWEAGASTPDLNNLSALAGYFSVTLDYLVRGVEPEAPQAAPAERTVIHNYYTPYHYEYRSKCTLLGLPLVHIHLGYGLRRARGIIAIGNVATGLVAIGGFSAGLLSIGGLGIGLLTLAGLAAGGLAVGGVAFGLLAALGGGAFSLGAALGGCAVSRFVAVGGPPSGSTPAARRLSAPCWPSARTPSRPAAWPSPWISSTPCTCPRRSCCLGSRPRRRRPPGGCSACCWARRAVNSRKKSPCAAAQGLFA